VIERDDRNRGQVVRAHWRWYVDPTVLVYDLRDAPADATGIDVCGRCSTSPTNRRAGSSRASIWRGAGTAILHQRERLRRTGAGVRQTQPGGHDGGDAGDSVPARRFEGVPDAAGPIDEQNSRLLLDFNSFVNAWTARR